MKEKKKESGKLCPSLHIEAFDMDTRFDRNCTAIDPSYCRFGAEALVKLLQTIEAQIDGAEKSKDIEYVHKMRVTSRRMRAAMPLFKGCFPKKRYKNWLNEIKKVTQFLGTARDLDVQISVIEDYIKRLQPTESKTGMEAVLEQHISQRTDSQLNVINGLQGLKMSRVLQQTASQCEKIIDESKSTSFNLSAVREKAFWQISSKLDEFLSFEDYVYKENEILKHHEMRIRAKWLRYTMETFAPLYEGELSEEIKIMKNFQDTLGEMHDCDVWIEYIPKLIAQAEKETATSPENTKAIAERNQGLLKFLDNIKEKRKNFYEEFASFWDEKKSKNVFEEWRKNASAGFAAAEHRTKAELENPYVKIGIIADIHANLNALEAVLQDAERRGITVFLDAGDILGFGAFPNEVVQTLYSKNALSVIGNFDLEVLDKKNTGKGSKKFSIEFSRKRLAKSYETYLRSLPLKLELEIAHKKLLIIHGTPDSVIEHLSNDMPEERFQELAKTAGADIMIFNHLHEQFTKKADGTLFISPGSVGRPGDGNPQAAYAAVNTNPFSVELVRVNYDVEEAADALRKNGAPESYAQMLLRGLSLEKIIAEDKARETYMERRCPLMTQNARRVAKKYWPDVQHAEKVRDLSLQLFDAMQEQHKHGRRERCWLECAAILHDIGLTQGPKEHHKKSLKLILNETKLKFTSTERQVIANIARYHRKSCPRINHYSFMTLNRELRRKVRSLAGILRLADGLDFSHQSLVQSVDAYETFDKVTIEGLILLNPVLEEYAANKKKDMFEKSLKKKAEIVWKRIPPASGTTLPLTIDSVTKTDFDSRNVPTL